MQHPPFPRKRAIALAFALFCAGSVAQAGGTFTQAGVLTLPAVNVPGLGSFNAQLSNGGTGAYLRPGMAFQLITLVPSGTPVEVPASYSFSQQIVVLPAVAVPAADGVVSYYDVKLRNINGGNTTFVVESVIDTQLGQAGNGAQGEKGEKGATGAAGPVGAVGPAGAIGAAGSMGPVGVAGPTGPVGPAGATGPVGATGLTGQVGLTGAPGPIGVTGLTGPAGATGPMGPIGPVGSPGINGANGAPGVDGAAGPMGIMGVAGPTGMTGPIGPQGIQGPRGAVGATGAVAALSRVVVDGPDGVDFATVKTVSASCAAPKILVSGGCSSTAHSDNASIVSNYPASATTWTCTYAASAGVYFTATAVCAN